MKTRVLKTLRVKLQRAQLWKRLKVPRRNVSLLNVLEGGQVWLLRVGRQASSWQELAGPPAVSLSLWVTVEFGNSTQSRLAATCTITWPPSGCAVDYTPRHLQVFWGSWQGRAQSCCSTDHGETDYCTSRQPSMALNWKAIVSLILQKRKLIKEMCTFCWPKIHLRSPHLWDLPATLPSTVQSST